MRLVTYTMKIVSHVATSILIFAALIIPNLAQAATQVMLSGPQQAGPIAPDANGRFAFPNLALKRNSVNVFTVTAKDDFGNTLSKNVSITQLSLDSVVVSKITTKPLSVQEVQQLVNDGVIKLDNPANFNVSKFDIVLTIGKEAIPISVPIAMPINVETAVGEEIAPKSDPGSGGSSSNVPDVQIIVFQQAIPGPPGQPPPPPMPGVIIIEGRIKTLKEFYSVRLLLMNASGIFTLSSVRAEMEFPSGGLSNTLPSDGIVSFGDILPGSGDQPGQAEREFIIRGDEIGVRPIRVNFGGTLTGPGISQDSPIPFNGSAQSSVEVKGPPSFQVQVVHPPAVVQNVPYELTVDITNTGETPALYASIDLDVGADAKLVDCKIDSAAFAPVCTPLVGPATRNLGNILPGQTVKQSFTILPLVSGVISSCMAASDQNISLQVFVGDIGCLVGKFPPLVGVADGIPTVSVLPTANLMGVGIDSPVVGFFSEQMNIATITTGASGTFRVLDDTGVDVPGQIRIENLNGNTVAIWQVNDGITNRLKGNSLYSVALSQGIRDLQGNGIANLWNSKFSTTSPTNDITPPALTLSIEPPVISTNVIPGQLIRINAFASDQGTGVARVELRRIQVGVANAVYELIDQKTIFDTSTCPCIFTVDSARLVAGVTYQFKATAYDKAGNAQDATIPVIVAASASIPVVQLPANPTSPVPQGISVDLTPVSVSAGVAVIGFFLDDATQPFTTVTLPPFQASLATLLVPLGQHTVRAVGVDGLNQTGEAVLSFSLGVNPNKPTVGIAGITNGANFTVGTPLSVSGNISDPVGIASVQYYLDAVGGTPVATGADPFTLNTTNLAVGDHRLIVVATNRLGFSNDVTDATSYVNFRVVAATNGQPPAAPGLNPLAIPANGKVMLSGTSVAGARIDIANVTQGLNYSISANTSGLFSALIDANGGDIVRAVAFDFTQSQQASAAAQATVPTAPALVRIEVTPTSINFTVANDTRDLIVTGFYADNSTANLTALTSYSSNKANVSSVNGAGRVVALTSGTATITALFQGQQAQVAVNVAIRTLVSIVLNPTSFTLSGISKTQQLQVIGTYSDNTTSPVTAGVTFNTNQASVAVINGSGLVTSIGIGSATITATVTGLPSAQSAVTVQGVVLTGIAVSPNSILFTAAGETRQLAVSRTRSDGTNEPAPPPITYSSDNVNAATVATNGLVTANANGNATITVTHSGFTTTVSVNVNIPVVNLPPPVVVSIDRPRAGEGDPIVVRGQNFASLPNDNLVRINGLQAQVQSARQDELVAIVPSGATSGAVTVQVFNQLSNNNIGISIYARIAQSFLITGAVDIAGASLPFTLPPFEVRAGDKVYLSGAADILAPLNFQGSLQGSIDSATPFNIPLSNVATDLTSGFAPGFHTLDLDLFASAGRIVSGPIYVFVGPDGSGPIAGQRTIIALAQSRPTPVTFINLRGLNGSPLPDGSVVTVTVQSASLITPDACCFISSAGGTIVNGTTSTFDSRFKTFTVSGGRIDVQYDPLGANPLAIGSGAVANIQVLPANSNGSGIGNRTIAVQAVTFTTFDTAATPRSQSAIIADGAPKVVTLKLAGIRDTAGKLVPDGSTVVVTAQSVSLITQDGCCFINSAGGTIVNGVTNAIDSRFKTFTVSSGQVEIQYDPGTVKVPVGQVLTANVQVLPARPDGSGIGNRVFALIPITLSSPSVQPINVTVSPGSLLGNGHDNRATITVKNIVDGLGNPVPDGTTIVVSAQSVSLITTDGCCFINSAGGAIVNGLDNPFDTRFKTFTVTGGQVQIVYSAAPVAIGTNQSATARIQLLPASPSGAGIGNRVFAVADLTLTGFHSSNAVANPSGVVADGFSKIVTVRLTGIRDTADNLVPDGATVVATAQSVGLVTADGCCFINSAGGTIVNGANNVFDARYKTFTVTSGQVEIQYDPGTVQVPVGQILTANVQVLPAKPDGSGISNRVFSVTPIALSSPSVQPVNVTINPGSALANGHDNRVTITVSNIVDGVGSLVPNGTSVLVSAQSVGWVTTDGCCFINSAGGTVVNGANHPTDPRFKIFTVTGGQIQVIYSVAPVALNTQTPATARVQFLPATPSGNGIGNRAFAIADVSLAAFQSADITGAGAVARNASTTYTISNILDSSGNPVPDGTTVLATAQSVGWLTPDGCCFVSSIGGAITNGTANVNDNRFRTFKVQGGSITVNFTAPASVGTSVIQLLPGRPNETGIGSRTFAIKSVNIQ